MIRSGARVNGPPFFERAVCVLDAIVARRNMKAQRYNKFAGVFSTLLLFGCASPNNRSDAVSNVPEFLRPSADESMAFSLRASGVQIYECKPRNGAGAQFEWVFKAPQAELFNQHGWTVGKHFRGPTWKADDGSSVVGEVLRSYAKDTNAIPWLLLSAKQNDGKGMFSKITSIQRVATTGGKAPAGECDARSAGQEIRVVYTAVYNFYVAIQRDK
jgi:hypothetical protein